MRPRSSVARIVRLLLITTMLLGLLIGQASAAARPKLGSMSGLVTAADGTKLAGVTVQAWVVPAGDPASASLFASTITQRNGSWQIKNLALGSYLVKFLTPDAALYVDTWYLGSVTRDGATVVSVPSSIPIRRIDGVLLSVGTITGTVYEPDFSTADPDDTAVVSGFEVGAYIPGPAQLILVGELATSDVDGHFTISNLLTGEYYLIGSDPSGYHTTAWGGDQAISLTPDSPAATCDLWTSPAGAISGRVTDGMGAGLPGLLVEAFILYQPEWGPELEYVTQNSTDSDGYYFLGGVPAGAVKVRASMHADLAAMYYAGTEPAVPAAQLAADVAVTNLQTTAGIDIALLTTSGSINGRVTELDGTTPIFNVGVKASLLYDGVWYYVADAWANEDGDYRLDGLYPGDYHLSFFPADGSPFLEENYHDAPIGAASGDVVKVEASMTTTINESLEPKPQE